MDNVVILKTYDYNYVSPVYIKMKLHAAAMDVGELTPYLAKKFWGWTPLSIKKTILCVYIRVRILRNGLSAFTVSILMWCNKNIFTAPIYIQKCAIQGTRYEKEITQNCNWKYDRLVKSNMLLKGYSLHVMWQCDMWFIVHSTSFRHAVTWLADWFYFWMVAMQ